MKPRDFTSFLFLPMKKILTTLAVIVLLNYQCMPIALAINPDELVQSEMEKFVDDPSSDINDYELLDEQNDSDNGGNVDGNPLFEETSQPETIEALENTLHLLDSTGAFITTRRTTTANEEIQIPTIGAGYDFTVAR